MKLTRRDWIKIFGGSGVLLFSGGCTKIQDTLDYLTEYTLAMENILNQSNEEILWTNKKEVWKNTTCMLCSSRCGLSARVVDTNLVFIKGNVDHPVNRGGICPLGVTGLQYQYSIDRIKGPRKRSEKRGSNIWEPINIENAFDTVDDILKEVSGVNDSVIFLSDEKDSAMAILMKYFLKTFNSNVIVSQNYKKGLIESVFNTLNIRSEPIYDIENSDFILSFGDDFLSYNDNFMYFQKAYSAFRSNPSKRGRHIQVESKFSLTAGKSDWWIPIILRTEHLLAQAIAYIIVKEDLIDKRFINDFIKGYDDLKTELLKTTDLEAISRQTTVPVSNIIKIARELSDAQRPVCIVGPQVYFTEDPAERIKSINVLNFLLGHI
jgi:anaerobic selenocysteine-containing dehydrogenase